MGSGTVTRDTLSGILQTVFDGDLSVCLNRISAAYKWFQTTGRVKTKQEMSVEWPVQTAAHAGVTQIDDGETLPAASQPEYGTAVLPFKIQIGVVQIGRLAQLGSVGPEYFKTKAGATLLSDTLADTVLEVARAIDLQIQQLNALTTKQFPSLGDIVATTNNTYAGIARAGAAYWQPYVNSNGGVNRSLTRALLDDVLDTLKNVRGANPDVIWAGTTAWNALRDLEGDKIQYDGSMQLQLGTTVISLDGIPAIKMPRMDANAMYCLDTNSDGEESLAYVKQHNEDMLVQEESTGSYSFRSSVAHHSTLKCKSPWRQGALLDVQ